MMRCSVKYCRFPNGHITFGHKCGYCGEYGHGQTECGKPNKMNYLRNNYFNQRLNDEEKCTVPGCRYKQFHRTIGHQCSTCNAFGGSCNCSLIVATTENVPVQKKCPICRIDGSFLPSQQIFTGGECVICMQSTKMIIFSCGHAQCCLECSLKLE